MTFAVIGWVVVHSLWQWTLIAGAASLALGFLRHARAHTRYLVGGGALLAMVAIAVATTVEAMLSIESSLRHRALYAFDGALMMPEVFARGGDIVRLAGMIWLAGVAAGVLRVAAEWRRVRRLGRVDLFALDDESQAAVARLQQEMRIRPNVAVHHSRLAAVPMVLGWRQPQILLPAPVAGTLTADQRRAILAHELGHIRRGDVLANLVQVFIDVIAFHHPAARWVSRQVRNEHEYACDDMAVMVTRDAPSYARALATLEDARSDCRLAVAAASGTLLDRVQRIVGQRQVRFMRSRGVLVCAIALLVAAALFAIAMNLPPPWLPAGVRLRRPGPRPPVTPAQSVIPPRESGLPAASRNVSVCLPDLS